MKINSMCDVNWLFNVKINDISVIYVTTRSARQSTDTNQPFYTVIPTHRPNKSSLTTRWGTEDTFST